MNNNINNKNKLIMLLLALVATMSIIGCAETTATDDAAATNTAPNAATVLATANAQNKIRVTFNEAVTPVTPFNATKWTVTTGDATTQTTANAVTAAEADMGDPASVILTLTNPLTTTDYVKVIANAEAVQNTAATPLKNASITATAVQTKAADTTVPALVSDGTTIELTAPTKLVLIFTEAVYYPTTLTATDFDVFTGKFGENLLKNEVTSAVSNYTNKSLTLTFSNAVKEGYFYSVGVAADKVVDRALVPNKLAKIDIQAIRIKETIKPTFTLPTTIEITANLISLELTASEPINQKASNADLLAGITLTYTKVAGVSTKVTGPINLTNTYINFNTQLGLVFNAITGVSPTDILTVTINADLVEDFAITSNTNTAATFSTTLVADTTAPTVRSIQAIPNNMLIIVAFDEPIVANGLVNSDVTVKSGVPGTTLGDNPVTNLNITASTLAITVTPIPQGQVFTVAIAANKIKDAANNNVPAIPASATPIRLIENDKPTFTVANISTTATTLVLTASEAISRKVADDTALAAGITVTYKKVAAGSTKTDNTVVPLTAATVTAPNKITLTFAALTGVSATDKLAITMTADLVQDYAATLNGNAAITTGLEATLQ